MQSNCYESNGAKRAGDRPHLAKAPLDFNKLTLLHLLVSESPGAILPEKANDRIFRVC